MRTHAPIVAILATAILALAPLAAAQEPSSPTFQEDEDKFVLQNEHVTVWFHGKKPMLKVFPTGALDNATNESEVGYSYKFRQVVEYRDVDGDGAPSQPEVIARLNLEKASAWEVEKVVTDGRVVLNLTLSAPVTLAGGNPLGQDLAVPDRTAVVSLVFTIEDGAFEVDAGDLNVTVPAAAVKYDFVVAQWPFLSGDDGRLALDTLVTGDVLANVEATQEAVALEGDNETSVGAIAWTSVAQGVTQAGEEVDVPVKAKVLAEADAQAANATAGTRIVYTYDAPALATLVHDPYLAVASADGLAPSEAAQGGIDAIKDVPGPAIVAVAAAAGVAALALRRRQA